MERAAELSEDLAYRYVLRRTWWPEQPVMLWVMLNPSTADGTTDDATIRRCIGYAQREQCGGIVVVNLFAWRATDPRELVRQPDPVGPANDLSIVRELQSHDGPVVLGWGGLRMPLVPRALDVARLIERYATGPVCCLGKTAAGWPRHPLYLAKSTPLEPWQAPDQPAADRLTVPAGSRAEVSPAPHEYDRVIREVDPNGNRCERRVPALWVIAPTSTDATLIAPGGVVLIDSETRHLSAHARPAARKAWAEYRAATQTGSDLAARRLLDTAEARSPTDRGPDNDALVDQVLVDRVVSGEPSARPLTSAELMVAVPRLMSAEVSFDRICQLTRSRWTRIAAVRKILRGTPDRSST
jgi:hypothetical protein